MAEQKMGKQKKGKRSEVRSESSPPIPMGQTISLKDIVVINACFWVYLVIQAVVIRLVVGELTGVLFFLGLIGVGFTLVSLYDSLYTRLTEHKHRCDESH